MFIEKGSVEYSGILRNAYDKWGRLRKSSELLKRKGTKGKKPELKTSIPEEEKGLLGKNPRVSTTPAPTPTTPDAEKVKLEPFIPLFVTENEELRVGVFGEAVNGDTDAVGDDKKEPVKIDAERNEVAEGMKAHAEAESKGRIGQQGTSSFKWLAN